MSQKMQTIMVAAGVALLFVSSTWGMYCPQTGRFLQRDPLGTDPGGSPERNPFQPTDDLPVELNLYAYLELNPVQRTDPTGLRGLLPPRLPEIALGPLDCVWCEFVQIKPPPERPMKWIWFGNTDPFWHVSVEVYQGDCSGSCRKIRSKNCYGYVKAWYMDPPKELRDNAGNTPKQHEEYHIATARATWDQMTATAAQVVGMGCMSSAKAECYAMYVKQFFFAAKARWYADNYAFDCRVYPPSVHKRHACNHLKKSTEEAEQAQELARKRWEHCSKL